MLLIPGRPQSRLRNDHGQLLEGGQEYYNQVQRTARQAFSSVPLFTHEPVPLKIEFYYAFSDEMIGDIIGKPATWYLHNIPNTHTAPGIILSALSGFLYTHSSQVEPLTVTRTIFSTREMIARFGKHCRRGATVVKYG